MFDKLKKRLTLIYTGIFSLIMVFVVAVTVAIGCISVLRTEKDMLIADIYDEWREWIGSGELPVDPALVKKGEMMSLMYDADGNIIIDQMTDSPYAAALTAIRASWPEPENETELLYFRDKKGTVHFFLAGGCTFWENGQIQARLYTFLNLEDYYDMAVDGMYFLFLLCAVCIMLAAGGGYYMAAKNIKPLEILFAREHEFAADASHELRTPLTSIRGWVETLMTLDDPTDENYRKGLEIINNETGRLYNMVEELLDFSRLQNGRLRMECRPLDLVAELTDAVLFCEARIQREGLILSYTEPEEMIPVYADPDRLRQVFINILDNAIKYSAPGGRITVKIWQGEYKAFIEIIDQGRGIPPEDLENVKTKFYKGSNSVRGSGIGLALVDSIMTALDGTMDLKSTLGRGTVVTLGLPIYKR